MTTTRFLEGHSSERLRSDGASEPREHRWLDRSELQAFEQKAAAWLNENRVLVEALAPGTIVMIDVGSGGHVSGTDHDRVRAEFHGRFGPSTYGFVHRVGNPFYVGAGLWALRSEA